MRRLLTAVLTAALLVGLLPFQVLAGTSQSISFDTNAPVSAMVGGPTYAVAATATSSLAVTFSIDAGSSAVCTLDGTPSTVSFTAVGTCVVDADQAGDGTFDPAPQVPQSFGVGQGDQTIGFTSTAPGAAAVGGATYGATATATSGLAVTLTIDATTSSVCSISGGTVSFQTVGTCIIDANQAGNTNWNAAPQAQQSFAVGKGSQTINFTSTAPSSAVLGDSPYHVTATGGASGNTVTFTIDASATSVCSITGASTVHLNHGGICIIDANQAGNSQYNAAPQAQQSFTIGKGDQTVSLTSTAPSSASVGGPTYTATATATSGLTVTLTIDATASSVCSISGSTVSFIGSGTCVIDANQAGNADWNPAPQAQQSFAVGKGGQTISFDSTAPASAAVGGPTYSVSASATSGLTVTLTIDGTSAGACTILGATVSFVHAGTCVIDANQAGDASWNPAPQVQQSFAVAKGDQTVSFATTAPTDAVLGGPTYGVSATATSGLTVALTIDPTASSVCSIAGGTVSFVGAGTCVIDANQAGNGDWNAGPQVQQSFAVAKGDQTISFDSIAPVAAAVGGPTYDVSASATSGLTVALSIDASAASVCSIAGSTVSFVGAGTCVIDADQAGDADWNPAPQAQQSFAVAKGDQTTSFDSTAPTGAVIGGPTYDVSATATSGLVVTITIDASAASVCSIAGSTVGFTTRGLCVIDANQDGDANWNAAPQAQQIFAVGDQPPSCPDAAASVVMNVAKTGAAGCTDPESDPLTYAIVTDGAHGTASIDAAGTWIYTPAANYIGADSFTFKTNDGVLDSNVATITVTVTNLQDDARNDAFTIPPLAPSAVDVLGNDLPGTGETGQPLTVTKVTQGTKGRVTTNGVTVTYDPAGCATGTDLFTYTISDGRTTDTASVVVTIARPGQNGLALSPLTDTPALTFVTGTTMSTTVPMRLSWCGVVASGASVRSYRVLQSSNGGSTFPTTLFAATTATSSMRLLAVGTAWDWRVRTVDSAGRTGAYATAPVARVARIQDGSTAIHYSSGWHIARSTNYSGGTEHYATATGASATVSLTNVRSFAIVSSKGIGRGSFRVWVDGVLVATISERSSSTQERRVLYVRSLTSGAGVTHTIRITPAGNGRVDIDAILALS